MKIVCFLLKLVLKILLLPVAFLLRFLCFIWNLLMQLSLRVLFAAAVGAGGIMELMEQLCERVEDVLTI